MLSNAYFLAKFRFDTAENEPAKRIPKFCKQAAASASSEADPEEREHRGERLRRRLERLLRRRLELRRRALLPLLVDLAARKFHEASKCFRAKLSYFF